MNRSQSFFYIELFTVINASFLLLSQPFEFKENELATYLLIPLLTIVQKYTISKGYEYNIDFAVFILIQASMVFLTFLIDVFLFDKICTVWNIIGGIIVILATSLALVIY